LGLGQDQHVFFLNDFLFNKKTNIYILTHFLINENSFHLRVHGNKAYKSTILAPKGEGLEGGRGEERKGIHLWLLCIEILNTILNM
jgi:hypothetical protein